MRMNKVLCKDIFSSKKLQQFYSMAFPTSTSFTCRFPHLSVLLETVAREDRVGKPTCCHIMRTVCGLLQFVPTVQPFQFTFACGLPQCLSYFPRISIIFNFISFWGCLTQNRPKQWDVMLAFKNDKNIEILMRCKPRTLRSHCVHRNLPWTVHHPKLCRLCSHDPVFPQTRSETNKRKLTKRLTSSRYFTPHFFWWCISMRTLWCNKTKVLDSSTSTQRRVPSSLDRTQ